MANWVIATFVEFNIPLTGLSPTVTIYKLSDNTKVVDAVFMLEVGDGVYKYDFTTYDPEEDYYPICDGGVDLISRYCYPVLIFNDHDPKLDDIEEKLDVENTIAVFD